MKSGFVAIVGKPNVGKSTLLNKFLGTKLVAISPKPQTTRHKILGILNSKDYQIVFIDTPGIFKPAYKLQKIMVKTAFSVLKDADVTVLLVEPFHFETEILKSLTSSTIVAINKIDLAKNKNELLPLIDEYKECKNIREIIPISTMYHDGLNELLKCIIQLLPEQEPFYPDDILSDRAERFFVSEIIREKIFLLYKEEIPYASSVVIEDFKEREKGKFFICATIYIERDSEKSVLIGKNGDAIKKLGMLAREEIEERINHPVYLDLWVKVRKNWRKDPKALVEFGYE